MVNQIWHVGVMSLGTVYDQTGKVVAIAPTDPSGWPDDANVRLIAAAPTLLAACKFALSGENGGVYQLRNAVAIAEATVAA